MISANPISAQLFDSIRTSLISLAEIGGNRLLEFDPETLRGCRELRGLCIEINITDLDFRLYCHPGDWGIRLSPQAPSRQVDATISGRLAALINLVAAEDKVSTSIQERVSFNGDVAAAQKLQKLLAGVDIDWEEALSRYFGDIAAVQIHQGLQDLANWFGQSRRSLLQTSSEYLREEARLSPTATEFEIFQAGVSDLKNDVARCEARLQRLASRLQSE